MDIINNKNMLFSILKNENENKKIDFDFIGVVFLLKELDLYKEYEEILTSNNTIEKTKIINRFSPIFNYSLLNQTN